MSKTYRKLVLKSDPLVVLKLPKELMEDLQVYAKNNARVLRDEIISRLIVTLQENTKLMSRDRLMRLIFAKELAYKEKKKLN